METTPAAPPAAAPLEPAGQRTAGSKRLRWLLWPLGLLGLVGLVPLPAGAPALPQTVSGRAAFAAEGTGPLWAGASLVPVPTEPLGPIAGYPAPRRALGPVPPGAAPLEARALALRAGGLEAVLVSLPVLLISPDLEESVLQTAGLGPQACLLLAATHTHSGPGGYWQSPLGVLGATGAFSPERRTALAAAAAEAITRARAAQRPARLVLAQADWAQGPASPRGPHALDPALTAVQAQDEKGQPLGTLAVYGMHPTVIPRSQRTLSGDWPEAAARALEQAGSGPALVLQGAGGDATWPRGGLGGLTATVQEAFDGLERNPGEADVRALGAEVARRTLSLLAGKIPSALPGAAATALLPASPAGSEAAAPSPITAPVQLSCAVRLVALPAPEGGRALVYPLRTAATSLLRLFAPRATLQTTLDLPGLRLLGVPGEPVGELGLSARAGSATPLAVIGLADGYAGYAETRARAEQGEGESSRTWHGPGLAAALGLEPQAAAR